MTTIRRTALTSATLTAIALLVLGCSPAAPTDDPPAGDADDAATSNECDIDAAKLGMAKPTKLVTDERGAYCHVEADLDMIDFTPYADVRVGTWSADGGITWGEGEPHAAADVVADAQRLSAQWIVGDFLDGAPVEMSSDDYAEWISTSDIIGEDWRADYLAGWEDEGKTNGLTVTPFTTSLVRDGQARVSDISLTPYSTSSLEVEGRQYVETCFDVTAIYLADEGATYDFSGRTCSTLETDGSTVTSVLEGTHGSFTVTDETGAVIAEEKSDS